MDNRMPRPRHIVIIGGGIIGATTAYYLTRHPSFNPQIHHITLVEATSIAAGASGKAGGLLGLWAYPSCLVPLSYRLHAELAAEHDGAARWGYRELACGQIAARVKGRDSRSRAESKRRKSTSSKAKGVNRRESIPIPQQGQPENAPTRVGNGALPLGPDAQHSQRVQDQAPLQNEGKDWQKLPKQDEAAATLMRQSKLPVDLDWIDSELVEEYAEMGLEGYTATAQVHPYQFTTSMAELANSAGVEIRRNAWVTKIGLGRGSVKTVEYIDRITRSPRTMLGVTDVVVAAGPWTGSLLPQTKVEGIRAHSVVFEADVTPYAVFTNISLPGNWIPPHRTRRVHRGHVDPEIYARPGREVYACGECDPSAPLPETVDLVEVDEAQCDDLVAYIGTVSAVLKAAPVIAKQACYMPRHTRPGQEDTPLVGGTAVEGLWVAAGHTCWGVQNAPATGRLMSEFIFEGAARSADIAELDPRKFGI
ncbi:putative FAD dependent oxidoreductase [Rosellinia necatrix]|uniref:Putative FAD dependent oxidoreductase n=1 Tax=Rosellinia necatrix TaxID=77044 RepID=A0A1S7UPE1_ROSNE|nr:putative FAD dependent oxidoreductase [Rosellinia necatrix]